IDLGYQVSAFDISPTAIDIARQRHPQSTIDFHVADLFDLPGTWIGAFDLVVESQNVQALPVDLRDEAIANVARLVAPGGRLLVIAIAIADGRDGEGVPSEGPPFPLTRADLDRFTRHGLELIAADQIAPTESNPVY